MLASTASSGGSSAGAVIGLIFAIIAYFAPTLIAMIRRVPNGGSVLVIDLFLGWTVIGWIVALAMAVRSKPAPQYLYAPPPQDERLP